MKETLLSIHVIPNSKSASISYDEWRKKLVVKINAPPVKNKANKALIDFLSKLFNAEVRIIKGETNKNKVVSILKDSQEIRKILEREGIELSKIEEI